MNAFSSTIRYPGSLHPGDLIAVTAPSSGIPGPLQARLDLVLDHLRARGYRVVEGECLRHEYKDASADKESRAAELSRFLHDPEVAAIFPPWGGELASELLDILDFEGLRNVAPKWLLGYSDISTLQLPLTLISGWATAHGSNLMDLAPTQTDALTVGALRVLECDLKMPVTQHSSDRFQIVHTDFAVRTDTPLNLTEPTVWKRLDGSPEPARFRGRLIGGCIDTVAWLAGTKFGDVPAFIRCSGDVGTILYLENVEMAPPALVRALLSAKRHRWFEGLSGLMLGRNAGPVPETSSNLGYEEAHQAVLGDLDCPVLYDVDIGHRPPQFTLVNGAVAEVTFSEGRGTVTQAMS